MLRADRNWEEKPEEGAAVHGQRNNTEMANRAMNVFNCSSLVDIIIRAMHTLARAGSGSYYEGGSGRGPPWTCPMPLQLTCPTCIATHVQVRHQAACTTQHTAYAYSTDVDMIMYHMRVVGRGGRGWHSWA